MGEFTAAMAAENLGLELVVRVEETRAAAGVAAAAAMTRDDGLSLLDWDDGKILGIYMRGLPKLRWMKAVYNFGSGLENFSGGPDLRRA